METSSGESTPKKHARHGSSGRAALPRRSTRGPLDIGEIPILTSNPLSPTTNQMQTPSHLTSTSTSLSASGSQYATPRTHSPRLPSPTPGSNLSTLSSNPSFKTAHSTLSPGGSNLSQQSAPLQKDFSYLLRPEIYHPLTLLEVPPPFRISTSQPDPSTPLPQLISSGHFRSAAIASASLLTSTSPSTQISPSDHRTIFSLIYTRLSSLTLCNGTALAAQEVKALEDLNSSYYVDETTGVHLVPWELRVLAVRLQGMGFNDARRGVMGYFDLGREARLTLSSLKREKEKGKEKEKEKNEAEIFLWENRLSELGIRVASALIEMEDLDGAARFLKTLKPSPSALSHLEMQKALLWLCIGDVEAARSCLPNDEDAQEKSVILALAYMADSDFASAVDVWNELLSSPSPPSPSPSPTSTSPSATEGERAMWRQNLGVCLLYLGRMDEARNLLSQLVNEGNSFHALTFNLSTIYELCTERSRALKIGLAEKVAELQQERDRAGGDGNGGVGWEKVNGDFKL